MAFENAVEYTQELSKIDTYAPEGKKIAIKYIESVIKTETRAKVETYDMDTTEPYIIGKITVENPKYKLLLEGHIDVVSPEGMENPFEAEIKDGIMYGRGVADMKGGCGAMLSAFIAAAGTPGLLGDVYLMYSTDEEYEGAEIKKALEKGHIPKVDFAMIAEPTKCQLHTAHKGEVWMEVEFFGKSAHSSTPELGVNAIYMAADFIQNLKKFLPRYEEKRHPLYGIPTLSTGVIQGGTTPNVVPPYAKVLLDKRYLPGGSLGEFQDEVEEILAQCKKDNQDFNAKTTVLGEWNAVLTNREGKEFIQIKNAVKKALGEEPKLGVMTGWGEGGFINMYGIPTVYFGPGDFKFAHTPKEQIEVEEIKQVASAYMAIIKETCF